MPEEFFTRGHLLGRARESFSAGGSLRVASVFFTVVHGQYRHTDLFALGLWRKPVASWARGIMTTLRQIDDWPATVLALIATVLLLTTIAVTAWIVYVYVAVLGILALLGIRQRSPWNTVYRSA